MSSERVLQCIDSSTQTTTSMGKNIAFDSHDQGLKQSQSAYSRFIALLSVGGWTEPVPTPLDHILDTSSTKSPSIAIAQSAWRSINALNIYSISEMNDSGVHTILSVGSEAVAGQASIRCTTAPSVPPIPCRDG